MIVNRRKEEKKVQKRDKEKKFVSFSMSSCRISKVLFHISWVHLYLVGF